MSSEYKRKDHLYEKAKAEGYASRAAYKLKELQKKFHLAKPGGSIIDLGCWPGGWLQVAAEVVGEDGVVVGIDLVPVSIPLPSCVHTVVGDIRDDSAWQEVVSYLKQPTCDAVISDMSPKLSGIPEADRAGMKALVQMGFIAAQRVLRPGGAFVAKVFKSNEAEEFVREIRPRFTEIKRTELDSSRNSSNEFYVVALGYKG